VLSTERDWLYDIARFVLRRRLFGHTEPARDRGLRAARSRSVR
jgi:hypothetical protein